MVAGAAALAGMPVSGAYVARLTGDEPHYLMTAISLAEDGDLDVADEYAAERYRSFHVADLTPQGRVLPSGRIVEPHDPLLPALLAGPVAAAGWVGGKVAMAAVAAALAALLLWTAVRRLGVPVVPAALVVSTFAVSAPLAPYASQIYPELPAALAVTAAFAAVTSPLGAPGLALLAGAVLALPWLGTKYVLLAAVLAAAGLVRLARGRRPRAAIGLGAALAVGGALFALAHLRWYGGLTPYAAGRTFVDGQLEVVGSDPDYLGRSRRLAGLLVDRDFGLAAWQPAWLLAVPALAALTRLRPPGFGVLVSVLSAGWLTATFVALTMQGWWFPGRQLVVILPLAMLALAWWVGGSGRRLSILLAAAAVGVVAYAWLAIEGSLGGLTWAVDFFETSNPLYRLWSGLLPDYLDVTARTRALHWAWVAVLWCLALAGWRAAGGPPRRGRLPRASSWRPAVGREGVGP